LAALDPDVAPPEPPADIGDRKLPLATKAAGTQYTRIHVATFGPVWFGWDPTANTFRIPTNRFDAPDRSFGVLYVASIREGSFAESIGRKPNSFRSNEDLATYSIATLALVRDLHLVDLHGGQAVGALGATGDIGVGSHKVARRWSKALHGHPDRPDGIEYRCRHNSDEIAVALYDRIGEESLKQIGSTPLVLDRVWLNKMRQRHRIFGPPA
jgi:RES domain